MKPAATPQPAGPHSPYRALQPAWPNEHPVDEIIERRAPQRRLRRRIQRTSRRLLRALAGQRALWLELEAQIMEYRHVREQAYFDVGFEHGFAAGQAHLGRLLLRTRPSVDRLAERVRELVLLDDHLSPQLRALALLQAVCAVGFGHDVRSEGTADAKRARPSL